MRRKNTPPGVRDDIFKAFPNSFCPYTHFDVAWRGLEYVNNRNIPGDIVLCGVATGGMAWFLKKHMGKMRKLWLYDMFDGGTLPTLADDGLNAVRCGQDAKQKMATDVAEVRRYVGEGNCEWVIGDVMLTIPARAPSQIALLYLDTDWYESTAHELKHLEPLVERGGVIMQDDMGLCIGAAKAVREYYGNNLPFMAPMDEVGMSWIKQ